MIRPAVVLLSLLLMPHSTPAAELLVGNKSADTVWRLSMKDGRKLGEFPTGQGPHEIVVSADGRTALVSNYGGATAGNSVTVIDLEAGRVTRTIDLGGNGKPHGMRWLPDSRRALVTTEASRRLLLIDAVAGRVEASVDLGEGRGHMVALSEDGRTAYVTKIDAGTVSRVDVPSMRKTHETAAGAGAEGVAVRPHNGEVWVSNREAGTMTVHDPATLKVLHTVQSPGFPIRVVFTSDGGTALATNARAATLSVIDARNKKPVRTVELASKDVEYRDTLLGRAALPIGVIASPGGERAYVAISGGDEIAVVDIAAGKVIARWATGREPDALAIVE